MFGLDSISNFFGNLFGGGQKKPPSNGAALNFNQAKNSGGLTFQPTQSPQAPNQQGVLGASTQAIPSGGGGGGGTPQSFIDQLSNSQNAAAQRNADLARNQAQSLYGQRGSLLQNQLGDLGNQKNSLLDQIGTNYGGVIKQAKDTLAQNLGALNQAKGDVTTGYENQKTDQGRLLNDVQRQNRMQARASGDLGSSFYENLQSDATSKAAQNVTNIGQQEQSQLDQIGQQIVTQNTDAGTKIDQLNQQEAQAKQQIIDQYQSAYNNVQSELGFNSQDSTNAIQQINNQMQATLDSISNTMGQYKLQAQQSGSVTNPISSLAAQAKNLAALQNVTQPLQDQQLLSQAIQQLQSDPSQFSNIVGQLQLYDAQNGTQLAQQVQGLQTSGAYQPAQSGFLGLGSSPAQFNIGKGPLQLPQQNTSYLDQLMQNLQY
jgi:hypothetical protein